MGLLKTPETEENGVQSEINESEAADGSNKDTSPFKVWFYNKSSFYVGYVCLPAGSHGNHGKTSRFNHAPGAPFGHRPNATIQHDIAAKIS